jgi:ATP-dependent helicase HrpA
MQTPLPIDAHRDEILETVSRSRVTVIAGATGCGKTSRVPLMLLEAGLADERGILVTQPRRIAAMGVAAYAAHLTGTELGTTVGYRIRHENVTDGARTRVTYATEGILLRELRADPSLRKYRVLVIDEIHERGINQDAILALLPDLLRRRDDLKVVLMSATMDEQRFGDAFSAPVIRVAGRAFPIRIEHLDAEPDVVAHAADVVQRALRETDGDVLVFMPDERHIRRTTEMLLDRLPGIGIHALYGNQSPAEQRAVLEREGRSVIVATNIAETSITLEGLTAVVDSGLIKEMTYRPEWAMSTFYVVPHARAGCEQRTGRCGRTAPGVCYRLYPETDHAARPAFAVPEILRSSLEQTYLQLTGTGIPGDRLHALPFLDAPKPELWDDARERLVLLGGLTPDGRLTKDGERMCDLPLPPAVTRMLLAAADLGCVGPVATIAATFATRPIFTRPQFMEEEADAAHEKFRVEYSDFMTSLKAIRAWRASDDRAAFAQEQFLHLRALEEIDAAEAQILAILAEDGIPTADRRGLEAAGKAVARGLIANLLVRREDGRGFRGRNLDRIGIFRGSALYGSAKKPDHVVATAVIETAQGTYARGLHAIPTPWLAEILPSDEVIAAAPTFKFLRRADKKARRKDDRRRRGGRKLH